MVRAKTLQIVWHGTKHGKEPVYSLDFLPDGTLLTAGGDNDIKTWKVEQGEDGFATASYLGSLQGHDKTVNCVRVSPTGNWLASSGDRGEVFLWKPTESGTTRINQLEDTIQAPWQRATTLRGHNDDVMDVSWSCDGTALVTASIDNRSLVWDTTDKRRGKMVHQLREHRHYTQGVAWDPAQQYIVTQSADRTCMVHALRPAAAGKKGKVAQQALAADTAKEFHMHKSLKQQDMSGTPAPGAKPEMQLMFQDEGISFFRRLAWSPDGSFLVVPAGQYKAPGSSKSMNTAYVYARNKWGSPVLHLPGHSKPVVAVRFCPVIFQRDRPQQAAAAGGDAPAAAAAAAVASAAVDAEPALQQAGAASPDLPFDLPYKMIFAVATLDSVAVYSTESMLPLLVVGALHYDHITDLAWSSDGRMLAVSSRDCYCSIAVFEEGELGTSIEVQQLPAHIAARMAAAQRSAAPVAMQAGATPAAAPKPKAASPSLKQAQEAAAAPVAGKEQGAASAAAPRAAGTATALPAGQAPQQQPPQQQQQGVQGQGQGQRQGQGPVKERKRIQPEPVAPGEAAAQWGQQAEGAKRVKRITPEAVGPAPAVVGDSQGGTQVFTAPPLPAGAQQQGEGRQPAAKQPKRVVPELISTRGTAGAAGGEAAGPAAAQAAGQPKAPKRITPIPVPAPQQQQQQQQGAAAAAAASRPTPTESGSAVGAASKPAGAKRITPTPIKPAGEEVAERFENAKQGPHLPPTSETSRDGASFRRITPVPLTATSPLPEVADSAGAKKRLAAPANPQAAAGGFNIAALAMAAGQKAAMHGKGK